MSLQQAGLHQRILDKALEQSETSSWERLFLHTVAESLHVGLDEYFHYYNHERRHSSIDNLYPHDLYRPMDLNNQQKEAA